MRKKLLKHLILALLMTVAAPYAKSQVAHVGDILCEGNAIVSPANYPSSGATAIGVVFYVDNTGQHGWAVALEDAGCYHWGGDGYDTPLPNYYDNRQAVYDLNGYENTRIVREHSTDHPAFYAVDFENGWYVPAIGQLNYLYGNLVEVNKTLQKISGTEFSVLGWEYYSSTEYNSHFVWIVSSSGELFHSGGWNYGNGQTNKRSNPAKPVRAVRNF